MLQGELREALLGPDGLAPQAESRLLGNRQARLGEAPSEVPHLRGQRSEERGIRRGRRARLAGPDLARPLREPLHRIGHAVTHHEQGHEAEGAHEDGEADQVLLGELPLRAVDVRGVGEDDENAARLYELHGFITAPGHLLRLYRRMKDVARSLEASAY